MAHPSKGGAAKLKAYVAAVQHQPAPHCGGLAGASAGEAYGARTMLQTGASRSVTP